MFGQHGRIERLHMLARKSLVAFMVFLLVFSTTPAQLWAEGAEGLARAAETVTQTEPTDGKAKEPAADIPERLTEPIEDGAKSEESAAPSMDAEESNVTESAQTQEPAAGPDAAPGRGDGVAAAGGDGAQVPAGNAAGQPAEQATTVKASAQVIGIDTEGKPELWASAPGIELPEGSTAADLFLALKDQAGLTAEYRQEDDGYFSLDAVTSPDGSRALAYDDDTMAFWQFFYNGASSSSMEYQTVLQDGDAVTWYYSAWGSSLPDLNPSEPEQPDTPEDKVVSASIEVIGADEEGNPQRWTELTTIELPAGSTAADLSEALFEQANIAADFGESSWGWSLNTITSPFDGRVLGWDNATQKYWQLFVNGESSSLGAGAVELKANDTVSWVYSASGEEKPEVDDIVINPDAVGPDWESDWPRYATAGTATDAKTPTGAVEPSWVVDDFDGYLSDPIAVNGRLYVTSGSRLYVKDAATGETLATARLAAATDSIVRMVYVNGLIVVPLSGGRLQALTADGLVTKWVTEALAPTVVKGEDGKDLTYDQQALTTLTVRDGYVYFGTAAADWNGTYGGWLVCVNLANGAVAWTHQNDKTGYYWAGAASVGDYLVIGGDDGILQALDPATGEVKGSCDLGAPVRSTVVAKGSTAYVVTSDGTLHCVTVGKDGSLAQGGTADFGFSSTSTPALAGGKIIVGGASDESYANAWGGTSHYGALFIIDAKTLKVEHVIDSYASGKFTGDIKSAPLVSVQADGTYVYFTVNAEPGGVFRYKLGDERAQLVYVPDKAHQNYSMSSIVCDANGVLYYVNDSGALFALASTSTGDDDLSWGDEDGKDDSNHGGNDNGNNGSDSGDNGSGNEDVPDGKQPTGKKPLGTVAPSAKPLTDAEKLATANASEPQGKEKSATAEEEDATPLAISESSRSGSVHVAGSSGMSVAALIAGGLGAIGLIAAGVWLVVSKRRGGFDA